MGRRGGPGRYLGLLILAASRRRTMTVTRPTAIVKIGLLYNMLASLVAIVGCEEEVGPTKQHWGLVDTVFKLEVKAGFDILDGKKRIVDV